VTQLADLKSCLERELEDVYADRDKLVAELEKVGEDVGRELGWGWGERRGW
jgi:hypothetical protein